LTINVKPTQQKRQKNHKNQNRNEAKTQGKRLLSMSFMHLLVYQSIRLKGSQDKLVPNAANSRRSAFTNAT